MLESFLLSLLFIFLIICSIYDLKTRQVPHALTYGLIGFAFTSRFILSIIQKDIKILIYSIIALIICYAVGYLLYKIKAWGGADVRIFTAIGVFMPVYPPYFDFNPYLNIDFIFILIWNILFFGMIWSIIWKIFSNKSIPFVPSFLISIPITLIWGNILFKLFL